MDCLLCQRSRSTAEGKYPFLIHEFKHSYLMLGEHQFYPGYCVLVLKEHYKEMTDIPRPMREEVFQEMMTASEAIEQEMRPDKMNMCSLGNVVPHVHWHFFPRYKSETDFKNPPWLQMHQFESAKVTHEETADLRLRLQRRLQNL